MTFVAKDLCNIIIDKAIDKFIKIDFSGGEVKNRLNPYEFSCVDIEKLFSKGKLRCLAGEMSSAIYFDESTLYCENPAEIPIEAYNPMIDNGPSTWYLCKPCAAAFKKLIVWSHTIPMEERVGEWSLLNKYGLPDAAEEYNEFDEEDGII